MVLDALLKVVGAGGVVWLVIRSLRRSDDPPRLIFKWLLSAGMILGLIWIYHRYISDAGAMGAFLGVALGGMTGLMLFAVWRHSLAAIVAKPFEAMYTGGGEEPEPKPFYSIARARQKQGKYEAAMAEIHKQLQRFPADVEGQLFLAQVQAEDMKDIPAAERTVERLCEQAGHAPANIASALHSMADWHLKIARDPDAARRDLEKLVSLVPDTQFAVSAAQRLAHIGNPEMVLSPGDRKKFVVVEGEQHIGLLKDPSPLKRVEADPATLAAGYVKHLEDHPLDTEARENLAVIYFEHYNRLDLATDQLEQMIAHPNQPARLVVRWLNLLADLQARAGAGYEAVRATLQRIIDRDPKLAAAELARKRIAMLKLELKAQETNKSVRLGAYEQNIGLKRGAKPPSKGA
jgi:tetratricopeptide (TPR) repeat protein